MTIQARNGYLTILAILFCATSLAGCGGDGGQAQGKGEAASITLEEVLRLGDETAGDTILFDPIARIAVNGDGDILVSEGRPGRSPLVHAFGGDGTYLSQVGGWGEGPGEYQYSISGPVVGAADSVYLWESWPNQILVYDPGDFSYVRSVRVEEEGLKQIGPLIGAIEDGWYMRMGLPTFLASDNGSMTINDDRYSELIKVNRDGSYSTSPLGTIPGNEVIPYLQEGGFGIVNVPFARSNVYRVGDDDLLYYGWSDTIEIMSASADGSTRDTIRYGHEPVPITDSEMTEASDTEDPLRQQLLANHDTHETKPAFQTFVVDDMSRIWIKLSSPEAATEAEWLILNRESHAVGHTTLPVTVNLEVIRGSYAYGIHQGDGAAPMVVVYEIRE